MAPPAKKKSRTKVVYRTTVAAAKRGATVAVKAAWQERATIVSLISGGALGYMEGSGKKLPHIEKLGVSGTWGVGLYLGGRAAKSPTAVMAGTALMTIAIYQAAFAAGLKELLKQQASAAVKTPAKTEGTNEGLAQLLGLTADQAAILQEQVSEISGQIPVPA